MYDFMPKKFSAFFYLNSTQFLGALNDNLYKLLLIFFLIDLQGVNKNPSILALAGGVFVVPFLLFSIPSGSLADRISKRKIIVATKLIEIVAVTVGIMGFVNKSPFWVYSGLFILATESAVFGPSKYGIIPEIVSRDKICKANGYLSSFTYLAIILGTFLGSFLTQATHRNFIAASMACFLIACIGIITCLKIPHTPAAGSKKPVDPFFLRSIIPTLKKSLEIEHLCLAILGSGYFLFIGAFTQLNIIPYTIQCLGLSDVEGGYLFLITALGIGAGSIAAGKISGSRVEFGLVPFGALGVSFCFFILGFCPAQPILSIITVFLLGVFGGIYLIPCDSFIQYASPNELRGQNVATNNFGGFVGVLIASALIYLFNELLGLSANSGFMILGFITLLVTLAMFFYLSEAFFHFLAMCAMKLSFSSFKGEECIPQEGGALLLASDWKTAFCLLSYKQRPICLAIECSTKNKWKTSLLKLLKMIPVWVSFSSPSENDQHSLDLIQREIMKGKLVCLIDSSALQNCRNNVPLQRIATELDVPFLTVKTDSKRHNCWISREKNNDRVISLEKSAKDASEMS